MQCIMGTKVLSQYTIQGVSKKRKPDFKPKFPIFFATLDNGNEDV